LQGYPDGTFRPANNINRVEAIKIVFNVIIPADKLPSPTEAEKALPMPNDADMTQWYAPYLRFTIVKELLDGQHVTTGPNNAFYYKPGENMTRKEVAEMIFRMLVYLQERDVFAEMMANAACFWVQQHDKMTETELNNGMVMIFTEAGFSEEEANALTTKYQYDNVVQADIDSQAKTKCGPGSTQETIDVPVGDPEGYSQMLKMMSQEAAQ
jgi:hypothetical protein